MDTLKHTLLEQLNLNYNLPTGFALLALILVVYYRDHAIGTQSVFILFKSIQNVRRSIVLVQSCNPIAILALRRLRRTLELTIIISSRRPDLYTPPTLPIIGNLLLVLANSNNQLEWLLKLRLERDALGDHRPISISLPFLRMVECSSPESIEVSTI